MYGASRPIIAKFTSSLDLNQLNKLDLQNVEK